MRCHAIVMRLHALRKLAAFAAALTLPVCLAPGGNRAGTAGGANS